MTPRARIVIVTYNAAAFVDAAVDSALAQTATCETIVVDNASSDGSIERLSSRLPQLHIVRNAENVGFGRAANAGAFLETGTRPEFVALLNPDAIAAPDWIEKMTAWMERRNVDIGSSVVAGSQTPFFAGGSWLPFLGVARTHASYAGETSRWVSGCALVARAAVFERLGGFDPAYFLYSEDVDLCLRAGESEARVAVYEESLVAHPEHGASSDTLGQFQKHRIVMESKGRLVRRFARGLTLPSALLFQILVSPALNGASLHEYPALANAFLEGFRGAGRVRAGQ